MCILRRHFTLLSIFFFCVCFLFCFDFCFDFCFVLCLSSNFGPSGVTPQRIWVRVGSNYCQLISNDHSHIQCKTPAGQGQNQPVTVEVDSQMSTNSLPFTYNIPVVDSVNPTTGDTTGYVPYVLCLMSYVSLRINLLQPEFSQILKQDNSHI